MSIPEPLIAVRPHASACQTETALFWTATDGQIAVWDRSSEDLFGWRTVDVVGRSPLFLDDRSRVLWQLLCRCASLGAFVRNARMTAATSDGRVLSAVFSSGPHRTADGSIDFIVHIVRA